MDHALMSYLRKLCLTDHHKGIFLVFFYEFYCCKSYSFSTKLLWLYNKSVLHTMYGPIPGPVLFCFIDFFIFMAVPCCIDYCNFTILVSDSVGLSVFLVFHRFVLGVCHFIWILELACQFLSKVHHFYFADFITLLLHHI